MLYFLMPRASSKRLDRVRAAHKESRERAENARLTMSTGSPFACKSHTRAFVVHT